MKNKAIISVLSEQSNNDESAIEVVTPGNFYKKDESYYAVYKETEISGMMGTTTTLKISPEKFSLIRIGTTNTKMQFAKDLKDSTLYNTPYGVIELEIETNDLKINVDDNGGKILIDYNLGVGGQKPENTILKIDIKSIENIS